MGVYIPNMDMPKSCYNHCLEGFIANEEIGCPLKDYAESHQYKNAIHPDCPLIEIDESEMEYLYKEFGLEKDENLTDRAIELKYAILMGYAYAKREIVTCGECICYRGDHNYCYNDYFARENGFCSYGERRKDESNTERD